MLFFRFLPFDSVGGGGGARDGDAVALDPSQEGVDYCFLVEKVDSEVMVALEVMDCFSKEKIALALSLETRCVVFSKE